MRNFAIAAVVLILLASPLAAQRQRASPHEQISAAVDGKKITIDYGRPYVKGRKMVGGIEPWGNPWRAGADEATKLTSEADLTIGNLKVPAGSYALFVLPVESGTWKLIVNKVSNQWGAFKYDPASDLGRVDLAVKTGGANTEQLTYSFEGLGPGKKGALRLAWETWQATVPVAVP